MRCCCSTPDHVVTSVNKNARRVIARLAGTSDVGSYEVALDPVAVRKTRDPRAKAADCHFANHTVARVQSQSVLKLSAGPIQFDERGANETRLRGSIYCDGLSNVWQSSARGYRMRSCSGNIESDYVTARI